MNVWLAGRLADAGRVDEALELLEPLRTDPRYGEGAQRTYRHILVAAHGGH
jgi:hypothetical protein